MPAIDCHTKAAAHDSSAPEALLAVERALRSHPTVVGIVTLTAMVLIAAAELVTTSDFAISLTLDVMYALPLALCAYGLGLTAGLLGATSVSLVGVIDALQEGLHTRDILLVFAVRLLSHLGIVGVAGLAAASARARERYLEAQRELVQMRADLVSAFSHDLRSPLATMIGYAELLRDTGDDLQSADSVAALDCILTQGRFLDRLISDMLSAGRSESASVLEITSFAPEALIAELQGELDQAPRANSLELRWEVAPTTPPLLTDRAKLASLIRNLVTNSLKFTHQGSVTVRVCSERDAAAHRITVEDTGPGIPTEMLPRLFERYYQAPGAQQRAGFGLGLFIVKRFAELLGASIAVQSTLGSGTSFVVTVPRLAGATAVVSPPAEPPAARVADSVPRPAGVGASVGSSR